MSSRRSLFVRIFFALLLAFAQQQAILHALDHDFERIHAPKNAVTLDDAFCAKCLAVAQLDHAAGAASITPLLPAFAPPRLATFYRSGTSPAPFSAYLSRAPPALS